MTATSPPPPSPVGTRIPPLWPCAGRALTPGDATDFASRRTMSLLVDRDTRRRAEQALRLACADWRLERVAEDAAIALGELVQNAIRHATLVPVCADGRPARRVITLILRRLGPAGGLLVGVRDGDPRPPTRRVLPDLTAFDPHDPDQVAALAEDGRGLWTVERLSERFGWYPLPPVGKVVWCELAT